jgi:hypothetical protein
MVGTLKCIVFSRDRAMQLDAFLASVERHVPDLFDEILVLFRTTGERHTAAYAELRAARPGPRWVAESSFRDDLLALRGAEELLVFHTDDDVYFAAANPFELRADEVCFSLRLGLNTTYCYPLDVTERLEGADVGDDRVSWNWRSQGPGAYSYPLALNGHVFRAEDAHEWLASVDYSTPNELESALQTLNEHMRPRMASFPSSIVVSIPANIVNETFANRHASGNDVEELNARFLAGQRLDTTRMDFRNVTACHQEIPFVFGAAA